MESWKSEPPNQDSSLSIVETTTNNDSFAQKKMKIGDISRRISVIGYLKKTHDQELRSVFLLLSKLKSHQLLNKKAI